MALYATLATPKFTGGMLIGLATIASFVVGSYAVFAHADRIQKRLHHVFFVAPQEVVKIDAKVFYNGPLTSYMIHLHSKSPTKVVGISVPDQATFDTLRAVLPRHFSNANCG